MQNKVKRGAGLLLLGLPLWAIALAITQRERAESETVEVIAALGGALFAFAGLGLVLVGFGLLVWGLLRD